MNVAEFEQTDSEAKQSIVQATPKTDVPQEPMVAAHIVQGSRYVVCVLLDRQLQLKGSHNLNYVFI